MAVHENFEIHSFVNKLMNLRRAGRNACLTLDCKDGEILINLELHLHRDAGHHGLQHPQPSPSRLRRRARRELARAAAAANAAAAKEAAVQAAVQDVAVQAVTPDPLAVDTAVQAVEQTVDKAVQAGPPPPHQEGRPSQGVLVLAEQEGQPLQAGLPLHHRLEDLLCSDTEYLPALSQFPRVTGRDQYRVERDRERERDMENFTKMLEDSLSK